MKILSNILNKKKGDAVEITQRVENKPAEKQEAETPKRKFAEGLVTTKDIIAPSAIEVDFDHIRIDNKYHRTLFVAGYPRFVGMNWLSPLINFDASLNVSMYIYPTDGKEILDDLRRKIAEMEAEISTDIQRGRVVNPATQAKLEDALTLQADLAKGEERFFQFGLYVTISAESVEELNRINKNLEAALGSLLIISKKATLQMEDGLVTTLPLCSDKLNITRNMDTTSLATTFPFVSSDLSDDKGIMYGINQHNGSLVIFDRFSMPNYNSVVFATAGAGKSYLIKLEVLRSLMLGAEIMVVDPENEYKNLCEAVGGQYIAFGYNEDSKINPFDLSLSGDEEGENALNSKMLSLHKLFKIMLGEMTPVEESVLDRAIMDAYKMKGITPDPETQKKEAPLIEDLYKSMVGMESPEAANLAARMEKYIKGSFAGIFNQKTTVNLENKFVVFGIRNLEDALRPVAMHIILDYIWTVVKTSLKKRILVVDEAWYLMQYPDSAAFLRGVVKRGRKYFLGVTTITQDVDDFLETPYGKEIVTNSSIQILLKQHSAAIDQVGEVFYLSEGEKQLLLAADKGEGIFFAGQNHVAIKVIASEEEHTLITSNPEEIMKMKQMGKVPDKQAMKASEGVSAAISKSVEVEAAGEEEGAVKEKIVVEEKQSEIKPQPVIAKEEKIEFKPTEVKKEEIKIEPKKEVGGESFRLKPEVVENTENIPLEEVKPAEVTVEKQAEEKTDDGVENVLQRRINQMEEEEGKKIEEHKKQLAEEEKAEKEKERERMANSLGGYKSLFKSSSLPPLPKFESSLYKAEVVDNGIKKGEKKPIFVNQAEKKIPQPPQLSKKPQPSFVKEDQKTDTIKPEETVDKGGKKMDYDTLFGNDPASK